MLPSLQRWLFPVFLLCAFPVLAHAFTTPKNSEIIPHYDLEMTGNEYLDLMSRGGPIEAYDGERSTDLQAVIDAGKRNLDWLKFINDHRDAQHKISLSSAATQVGIPIDHPRFYNPEIIMRNYGELLRNLPPSLKDVILGSGNFSQDPPMTDADFIVWSGKVDGGYQLASRWILMSGYLNALADRRSNDVRGYYFLSQNKNLQAELAQWSSLSAANQKLYVEELTEMCLNNGDGANICSAEIAKGTVINQGFAIYTKYYAGSKKLYENFFKVQVPRTDVKWDDVTNQLIVPFNDPHDNVVQKFLTDNVQDEWHWGPWHLFLNFQTAGNNPLITFVPGATPHVDGLAGNTITMDANQPLTEYNVQWTIRHEFGHVLGFPDCYVEFYDAVNSVMVSYQLDTTNLMCSRRGHLQERHYDELKNTYDKQATRSWWHWRKKQR